MKRYSLYASPDNKYTLVYNGNPKLVTRYDYSFKNLEEALKGPKALLSDRNISLYTHLADFDHLHTLIDTHPELYL